MIELCCNQCGSDMPIWTWLAGLIDGEGAIMFMKETRKDLKRGFCWHARMTISNTSKELLETIQFSYCCRIRMTLELMSLLIILKRITKKIDFLTY